jgi:formylmethanofuran dehydrogenase subunit E
MTTDTLTEEAVDRAVRFHGSLCPGLALGVQVARIVANELGETPEDLVALVETDICAVDGVQALTGCTLGNRNLILHDVGKNAYSFWRRSDGKAIRIHGRPAWDPAYQALRKKVSAGDASTTEIELFDELTETQAARILAADPYTLFHVDALTAPMPQTSSVDPWVTCARCGENVQETRTRRIGGETVCAPCFETARAAA